MYIAAQILLSGLFQGSIYAIAAVGLALVWTTVGVFNFSHGVFMTVGAYVAWQIVALDLPIALAMPLSIAVMAGLGWVLQAALVRPVIGRDNLVLIVVITTLAGASLLENGTLQLWGPRPKQLPPLLAGNIELGGLGMSLHQIAIIVATPVIVGLLWVFLMRTRLGLALRAIGQNEEASLLVGLNVKALYGLAFAIAAALAGLSGVFIGGYHIMSPSMGAEPLLKALVVVVFGGLSSIAGPIAAAYLIGLFEAACSYAFGLYWTPTLLFAVLILTLMIRPQGLIGSRSRGLA